jgi:hypothetical protein
MLRRLSLAAPLAALALAAARAEPPPQEMGTAWARRWDEKHKEFSGGLDRARAAALKNFDKAIERVDRQTGLTPAARTDRRRQLQAAREAFERDGKFPPDDDFAAMALDYFTKVNKAAVPLTLMIDEVIEKGSKTNNDELEKQGLNLKADLEKQLGGASRLVENSVWHGELHRADGSTIPYHLYVGKMAEGGLFKGHVEDNPGVAGNWSYDVQGQTRALGVEYRLSQNRRGNFTAVTVVGIVSGDRLIANITQVAGRGKPATALIVLKRVK